MAQGKQVRSMNKQLPHLVRSRRYGHRLMPLPEFQARERIASLRASLPRAGALARLSSTGVSMNLTNRLRAEFGADSEGLLHAAHLDAVTVLLIELHALVRSVDPSLQSGDLRDWMKQVVGGGHPFPPKKRAKRPMKPKCWWYEYGENNVH